MEQATVSLKQHRVEAFENAAVIEGQVRYAPSKSFWFLGMASAAMVGGLLTMSWSALLVFILSTAIVLLFGHSLGSHRKLIHNSFQCPKWLEYTLVYCGVQVGLAGPIGLLRQHELRDYAQRLPQCHSYLRHGETFWRDAWWQLNCNLHLNKPPKIRIEPNIVEDRFYQLLERTWMLQQIPIALLLFVFGGWAFVFWGVCARITAAVFGHWLIGYFAHNHGAMNYQVEQAAVQGRNIHWTSLITMGESWHNNHHAYPGSARLGLAEGEWDPGWWMLLLLKQCRMVWGIKLPHDLARRSELRALIPVEELMQGTESMTMDFPSQRIDSSLTALHKLCKKSSDKIVIHTPAAILSRVCLRRIAGTEAHIRILPTIKKLNLMIDGRRVQGLPVLNLCCAQHGRLGRLLGMISLPLSVAIERLRPVPN